MNLKQSFLSILSFFMSAGCFTAPILANYKSALAENDVVAELTLEDIIVNIHDNNLNDDSSNDSFTLGLRHGSLSTSSQAVPNIAKNLPGCVPFNLKDEGAKYIGCSDSGTICYASHNDTEKRIWSANDDRFIVKFTAKETINISTSFTGTSTSGGCDDTIINMFVVDSSYSEISHNNWLDKGEKVYTINNVKTASRDKFSYSTTINKGQTFYWEWGFQWDNNSWTRNLDYTSSSYDFCFKIEKDGYEQKTVSSETYNYNEMVGYSAGFSGNDVTPNNSGNKLISYGFRHGSISNGNIQKFANHTENLLGIENGEPTQAFFQNWRFATAYGDAAIIYLKSHTKTVFNFSRVKFGNDLRRNLQFNVYINGSKISSKLFDGNHETPSDFTIKLNLEKDDEVYLEFLSENTYSFISMGSDGGDFSTLPVFKFTEYTDIETINLTPSIILNGINSSSTSGAVAIQSVTSYQIYNGSITNHSLVTAIKNGNYLGNDNAKLTSKGISLNGNGILTIALTAIHPCTIETSFLNNFSNSNLQISSYQFVKSLAKTKQMFTKTIDNEEILDKLNGLFVLDMGDILYLEFAGKNNASIDFHCLNYLLVSEKAIGEVYKPSFPLYETSDYSNRATFTHKEITFETARIKCSPIQGKDFSIQLVPGLVSEKGENLSTFSSIIYESGEYLEGNIEKKVLLAGPSGTFDELTYAAAEDYRIKASSSENVVYKIIANKNTALKVNHPKTTGGWIDGNNFFDYYQSNGSKTKLLKHVSLVENKTIYEADEFAYTFNMKQGDIAYLVFGSSTYGRNLNIAFNFSSFENEFNSQIREDLFGAESLEVTMSNVISNTIKNNLEPVTYGEIMTITLAHGSFLEYELFDSYIGTGDGEANDSLINGDEGQELARFFRWQVKAGKMNDDAIMVFKAEKDVRLSLTHDATKDSWASFSSMRYYILDSDNFIDYQDERYIASDLEDNYFGYDISLKQGQSLLIDYGANDETSSATFDLCWTAHISTNDFDISQTHDFTDARILQEDKDQYLNQLKQYVNHLIESDYSISNWAKICSLLEEFENELISLSSKEEVINFYNKTLSEIQNVKTLEQEQEELQNAIESAIKEANDYASKNKKKYSKENWDQIESLLYEFEIKARISTSITLVNLALQEFKNAVDEIPMKVLSTGAIVGISLGGVAVLSSAVVLLLLKKKKVA